MKDLYIISKSAGVKRAFWSAVLLATLCGLIAYLGGTWSNDGLSLAGIVYPMLIALVASGITSWGLITRTARNIAHADKAQRKIIRDVHESGKLFQSKQENLIVIIDNQIETNLLSTAHLNHIVEETDQVARSIIGKSSDMEASVDTFRKALLEFESKGQQESIASKELLEDNKVKLQDLRNYIEKRATQLESDYLNVTKLAENARNLTGLVQYLKEISDQTNLLALNAAIEAARAGEHGRGFAIVADEVRKLSLQSEKASDKIGRSIVALAENIEAKFKDKLNKDSGSDEANMLNGFQGQMAQLGGAYERLSGLLTQALEQGVSNSKIVSEKTFQLLNEMQFQDITRQQIDVMVKVNTEINEYLENLQKCQTSKDCCDEVCKLQGFDMDKIRAYYTMRNQRVIHDVVFDTDESSKAHADGGTEGEITYFN